MFNLGARPSSERSVLPAVDEKMILDEKRRELNDLELKVLKIVIAVERINYYTMGIILPRDQNCRVIPFFESTKDQVYDIQSCMKLYTLIKLQIERLEQIERQLTPPTDSLIPRQSIVGSFSQAQSYYFQKTNQGLKDRHEFRENFSKKEGATRCINIWNEFSDMKETSGLLSQLKVNLLVRIEQLCETFQIMNHRITIQLFKRPDSPQCYQTNIQSQKDSWLFTEIAFAETLLKDELILIIKVFRNLDINYKQITKKAKINKNSTEPFKLSFLVAYQIINLSDKFFENQMKDGKFADPLPIIRFYQYESKYNLEEEYDRILKDLRENEFQGKFDDDLSNKLSLRIKFAFMSSITRNTLALRLDQSQIIRQKFYWDKMVKGPSNESIPRMSNTDPQKIFQSEMEKLNLSELQKKETQNQLRVNINSLVVDKSKIGDAQVFKVQAFLVNNDSPTRASINFRFLENFYNQTSDRKFEESFQSQISTLRKGVANFQSEFFLKAPTPVKTKDLQNYKLVIIVFMPKDSEKKNRKVTEQNIEENPLRYIFYPCYMGKLPLYDKDKNQILGGSSNKQSMNLIRYDQQKSLAEQIESNEEIVPGTYLQLQIVLNSHHFSNNPFVNLLIEQSVDQLPFNIQEAVKNLSNNDLLKYHTRIMTNLLNMFNKTQFERSYQAFQSIIILFKRFSSKEMSIYKPLIQDYQERWNGDPDSDKKLLNKILELLKGIPSDIQEILYAPVDQNVNNNIRDIKLKLQALPALIQLVCRLFSREFTWQYASIREKLSTHFRKVVDVEKLCIYRHDIKESNRTNERRLQSSRPAIIVTQLAEDINQLQQNLINKQSVVPEEDEDDSEEGIDSLLQSNADEFNNRLSQYQARRSTINKQFQTVDENTLEHHFKLLKKQVTELINFEQGFSKKIKDILFDISKLLHEDIEISLADPDFCTKVNRIIELQKIQNINQQPKLLKDLETLGKDINETYRKYIQQFPKNVKFRIQTYIERRKDLRIAFWSSLEPNLLAVINFIDKKFVLSLFSEKLLLKKIQPISEGMINSIIPQFEIATRPFRPFNKQQLEYSSSKVEAVHIELVKKEFEQEVKDAVQASKDIREFEDKEIDFQLVQKLKFLSDFLASDCFILLPSDEIIEESIQETLATKISISVYNQIKQYKNQWREEFQKDRIKDTTASEMLYLFFYKMSIFEKKFNESIANNTFEKERLPVNSMLLGKNDMSQLTKSLPMPLMGGRISYRPIAEMDDFDQDILNDLSSSNQAMQIPKQITVIVKEEKVKQPLIDNPLDSSTIIEEEQKIEPEPKVSISKPKFQDKLQVGLGAQKELTNFKDRLDYILTQFDQGVDRRLCLFLNEMEDALIKYLELKNNVTQLAQQELKDLKVQYISLFQVLSMKNLSNLSLNALKLLYGKRAGCLDRLVKQVVKTTAVMEFGNEELFFMIKKLQVVEDFCKNVIEILCEPSNKKYISELSDKYTYKSIVSQVWVLQLSLLAEQAQVQYEFQALDTIFISTDNSHKRNVIEFQTKVQKHYETQQKLWLNYKDMDDMILPDENIEFYGIQGKIIKILQSDLEDLNQERIDNIKLTMLLRALTQMMVQIDELTQKTQQRLSYRILTDIIKFFNEIIDVQCKSNNDFEKNHAKQKNKKKQICDTFSDLYSLACIQSTGSEIFKEVIQARVQEVTIVKKLYLHVIEFEKVEGAQKGCLLAQLISYYELMQFLQDKSLSVQFQNNIKLKYKQMIDNINASLYKQFEFEFKRAAAEDSEFICQKQSSQYRNQMKEVKAFMNVEDYFTYKQAYEKGLLNSLGNKHNVNVLGQIIDTAIGLLVPQKNQSKIDQPNQFFDVALKLLSDKTALQETNYEFSTITETLNYQTELFNLYQKFEQKTVYCIYYRIKIDSFLPKDMQVPDRYFIYKTPSGYNQEFIKQDLSLLLGTDRLINSKDCDVKPLQPLSSEYRRKYNIPQNTKDLSDTPEEVHSNCPPKFRTYFSQNFKKQFYFEKCPQNEPAGFDDEYVITIYEVRKNFPTMTMIQQVDRIFEKKIPRVKIQLWEVQSILKDIQTELRRGSNSINSGQVFQSDQSQPLAEILQKYLTNDDVGGGFLKLLDNFFFESLAVAFNDFPDQDLKRNYLDLFKHLETWLDELNRVIEMFAAIGRNAELTKLAEERLDDRQKVLNERRMLYKLGELQEKF